MDLYSALVLWKTLTQNEWTDMHYSCTNLHAQMETELLGFGLHVCTPRALLILATFLAVDYVYY